MRRLAITAALSLLGAAAFAQDVKVDFDKSANFGAIKTFTVKIGTSWNNEISEKRIVRRDREGAHREGLDEDRRRQGRRGRRAPRCDREAEDAEHLLLRGGYGGYGWRGWGGAGMGTATTTESEYLVGTLVVDIFDAKTKQLMFRGHGPDEISDKPEKNMKKIDKATDKMFKDFPPGSGKK